MILAALALVAWVAVPAARSSAAPGPSGHPHDEDDALALLAEADEAAAETPYQGLRFVSAWTAAGVTTTLVRLTHLPRRGTTVRVVGTGADKASVRYEGRSAPCLPGCSDQTLDLLGRHYELTVAGLGSVAGRSSHVVEARRSNGSLAARFWLDRDTGLIVRREVRGRHGEVVRASAFINLNAGVPLRGSLGGSRYPTGTTPSPGPAPPAPSPRPSVGSAGLSAESFGAPTGSSSSPSSAPSTAAVPAMPQPWQQRLRSDVLHSLRARGWTLPRRLPHGLTLVDARRGVVDGTRVVHLSYSDGLSSVSVFVQRGTLAANRMNGWHRTVLRGCCAVFRQHTVPRRAVWSADGRVYTVVAHAPPGLVKQAVTALPHESESRGLWGGFWARMARGFTDLGSWLSPFG